MIGTNFQTERIRVCFRLNSHFCLSLSLFKIRRSFDGKGSPSVLTPSSGKNTRLREHEAIISDGWNGNCVYIDIMLTNRLVRSDQTIGQKQNLQ